LLFVLYGILSYISKKAKNWQKSIIYPFCQPAKLVINPGGGGKIKNYDIPIIKIIKFGTILISSKEIF
jgi:hypothetical protein